MSSLPLAHTGSTLVPPHPASLFFTASMLPDGIPAQPFIYFIHRLFKVVLQGHLVAQEGCFNFSYHVPHWAETEEMGEV